MLSSDLEPGIRRSMNDSPKAGAGNRSGQGISDE